MGKYTEMQMQSTSVQHYNHRPTELISTSLHFSSTVFVQSKRYRIEQDFGTNSPKLLMHVHEETRICRMMELK
jgi:hypothetical protein